MSLGADDKEGRLLPKALPHLHLHAGGARLPQLAALAERAAASLTDKAALRHVQKLQERLALLATAPPQEGEEPPSVEDILAAHRSAAARAQPLRPPAPHALSPNMRRTPADIRHPPTCAAPPCCRRTP